MKVELDYRASGARDLRGDDRDEGRDGAFAALLAAPAPERPEPEHASHGVEGRRALKAEPRVAADSAPAAHDSARGSAPSEVASQATSSPPSEPEARAATPLADGATPNPDTSSTSTTTDAEAATPAGLPSASSEVGVAEQTNAAAASAEARLASALASDLATAPRVAAAPLRATPASAMGEVVSAPNEVMAGSGASTPATATAPMNLPVGVGATSPRPASAPAAHPEPTAGPSGPVTMDAANPASEQATSAQRATSAHTKAQPGDAPGLAQKDVMATASPAIATTTAVAVAATEGAATVRDELRRFAGELAAKLGAHLAPSTPSAPGAPATPTPSAPSHASTPFAPPSVLRSEVVADVKMNPGAGRDGASFRLDHPELGRIELSLRMQAGQLEVRATTQDLGASMAIRASEALLRERVARRGVNLGSVRVATRDKHKHRRVTRKRGLDMEA